MNARSIIITIFLLAEAVLVAFLYACCVVSGRESRREEKEEMRRHK